VLESGTREGVRFEVPLLFVFSHGGGRARSLDLYDGDQLAEAQARYAELCTPTSPPSRLSNLATRAEEQACEAFAVRDWDRFAALFAPHFRSSDRRSLVRLELGREQLLEPIRPIFELGLRRTHRVHATRGDRLALMSVRLEGSEAASGPSEVEFLQVIEVDERGVRVAAVGFDPDDLDAGFAELDLRYAAQQEQTGRRASLTRAFTQAFAERDWGALAALLAPDLVVQDHRRLGWETLRGPEAYVQALRSLVELAPDVRLRVEHAEMRDPGYLYFTSWQGTREGGAFEEPSWIVCELDVDGRIRRFDQYALEQRAEAEARLAQIAGAVAMPGPRDPLRIPPNAASRTSDRLHAALRARDLDAFQQHCATSFSFDDRRRSVLTAGDLAMFLANNRWLIGQGLHVVERTLLAIAGDRLALEYQRWSGAGETPEAEVDLLAVTEIDTEGRASSIVIFDPDDRRAASAEMRERFLRGPGRIEVARALHDHDLARLRAALPDDFWFHDRRRTGAGRLDGADAYVHSVAALFEQAPDLTGETLYHIAVERHGSLSVGRTFGTLADGGTVESVFLRLSIHRNDEYAGIELYELDDLPQARARFEALRPAPVQQATLPAPVRAEPNAVTRAMRRFEACAAARDWQALTDLHAPDFVYEDRRALVRDTGSREKLVASVRLVVGAGGRESHTVLATAGNRLALIHQRFSVVRGDVVVSELEALQLLETDAGERFVASVAFDPADRAAADAEMRARFEARSR
jgi:hypothetical protein